MNHLVNELFAVISAKQESIESWLESKLSANQNSEEYLSVVLTYCLQNNQLQLFKDITDNHANKIPPAILNEFFSSHSNCYYFEWGVVELLSKIKKSGDKLKEFSIVLRDCISKYKVEEFLTKYPVISDFLVKNHISHPIHTQNIVGNILQKNLYSLAKDFYENGGHLEGNLRSDLIESIKIHINKSQSVFKLQALVNLFGKAKIDLPSFLQLSVFKTQQNSKQLELVLESSIIGKLVDHYVGKEYAQAKSNEFQSYFKLFFSKLYEIQKDYSQEMVMLSGYKPLIPNQEYFVYRGLTVDDAEDFLESITNTGYSKFGLFNLAEGNGWQFSGNYFSFLKNIAQAFLHLHGHSKHGVILKVKMDSQADWVCGASDDLYEVISSNTLSSTIKSITIDGEEILNPNYIPSEIDFMPESDGNESYEKSGCKAMLEYSREVKNKGITSELVHQVREEVYSNLDL